MKKICSLLIIIFTFFGLSAEVNATDFSALSSSSNRSNSFTVDIYSQDFDFSGVIFEIEYDADFLQYNSISNTSDADELSANDLNNKLTVLYMPNLSVNLSDDTPIFRLKFNTKSIGESKLTISTREILDINGDTFADNIEPFDLPVTIVENSNGTMSIKGSKSSSVKISTNSSKNNNEESEPVPTDDLKERNFIIKTLSDNKDELKTAVIILPILLIVYYIFMYIKDKRNKK